MKETLEEAAEKFKEFCSWGCKKYFVEGAKWQQERSYSEEDIKEAYSMGRSDMSIRSFNEKFKKK